MARPNAHGVLIGAKKCIIYNDKRCYARVEIAQWKGLWYEGSWKELKGSSTGCGGGGVMPSIHAKPYKTANEAESASILGMIRSFQHDRTRVQYSAQIGKCVAALRERLYKINDVKQNLFDYQ